mmetsp:Transcript_4333/g.11350  ORF Transcript_4333/g.11350 Transcript_4333/m.11350 type:complete len:109 (+) Transcript_4333:2153-2479(+)
MLSSQRFAFLCLAIVLLMVLPQSAVGEIDLATGQECLDSHENCPFWAATEECAKNPAWMNENCRLSCKRCHVIRVSSQEEMQDFIARKQKEHADKRKTRSILAGKEEL